MQIDQDYLKGLLEAFEASDSPDTDIIKLKELGFNCETDTFVFHMRLLEDRGLIVRSDGEPGFGAFGSLHGSTHWAVMPLRLTAIGHDFLDALRNQEVWSTLKTGFKDASMGTLMTVSKELFNRALNKQLDKIFD
ncbi:hypothetical protein P838_04399 [Enterobacter hormaechei]|uniref:DUF2513 domain-containing protein n=1 Tax=Enterobacter hormaechei TaxID=158836 RepID=UPI00044EB389|nr:DUF2513 domain-containing protein [Enterobacter hormaechei]EUL63064.1 hypothetical protein P838_04399 [Enterobacter hormaechei]EUL63646.1 hypothetical protein P839_04059 [Enterobacter hormaechei]